MLPSAGWDAAGLRICDEFADPGELEFGKGLRPIAQQTDGVFRRYGKEQLIVFTIAHRLLNAATASEWQVFGLDVEADAAACGKPWQVFAQAITEIHHGGDAGMFDEPLGFLDTRMKMQVLALDRAAELTGHEQTISRFGVIAGHPIFGRCRAGHAHRDDELIAA